MSESNRGDNHVCLCIKCRDIARRPSLPGPSVRIGRGRSGRVEGRSISPASCPGPLLSLCVFGWAPGPREMRGSVCSAERVFWSARAGWNAGACAAWHRSQPHHALGLSMWGRDAPVWVVPGRARPFAVQLNGLYPTISPRAAAWFAWACRGWCQTWPAVDGPAGGCLGPAAHDPGGHAPVRIHTLGTIICCPLPGPRGPQRAPRRAPTASE